MNESTQVVKFDASNAVIEYSVTNKVLEDLKEKYGNLPVITDKEGYEQHKLAQAEIRQLRVDVEKHRKELKSDALMWGKKVDTEAKRVTTALLDIENPIRDARKLIDDKKAKEAAAKREKKEKRVNDIRGRIGAIKEIGDIAMDADVEAITKKIAEAEDYEITVDCFDEFEPGATMERDHVIETLKDKLVARQKYDADQVELAEQREEQRKVAEQQAEEQKKLDAEKKKIADQQAAAQKKIDDDKAKVAAQQKKLDDEQMERDRTTAEEQAKENDLLRKRDEARKAKEAAEQEEQRRLEQAPDIDKLHAYAMALKQVEMPVIINEELREMAMVAYDSVSSISANLLDAINLEGDK